MDNQFIQVIIILVGAILILGFFDLKKKVSQLDKLDQIEPLIRQVGRLVEQLQDLVTSHHVSKKEAEIEIKNLKERIAIIEQKLENLEK